jgi:molybdopterin/thiamine biosynthesis adenylyltransferase
MDDRYIRQQELINQQKLSGLTVAVVGCGAVGSFTALSLCKMGIRHIALIDPDTVSIENLPNQFFREEDLGKKKVLACGEMLHQFDSGIEVNILPRPFIKQKLETDIVISSVDSMDVRKRIWKSAKNLRKTKLLIDPRMAAHVVQVYTAIPGDPSSCKSYESTLITESQALPDRCTARSIIYTVLPLAALICRQVAAFANDQWIEPAITLDMKTMNLFQSGVKAGVSS